MTLTRRLILKTAVLRGWREQLRRRRHFWTFVVLCVLWSAVFASIWTEGKERRLQGQRTGARREICSPLCSVTSTSSGAFVRRPAHKKVRGGGMKAKWGFYETMGPFGGTICSFEGNNLLQAQLCVMFFRAYLICSVDALPPRPRRAASRRRRKKRSTDLPRPKLPEVSVFLHFGMMPHSLSLMPVPGCRRGCCHCSSPLPPPSHSCPLHLSLTLPPPSIADYPR